MLVNHNIKNFFGGVSQQEDEYRFDNQVESMENCLITKAEGLRRRNPTDFVVDVGAFSVDEKIATHSYDRGDGLEKYGMILDGTNGLRIFDADGVEKTVNIVSTHAPLTYLATTDYEKNIQFLTVGDTTWILNKKQVPAVTATSPVSLYDKPKTSAFAWIKRTFDDGVGGGYEYTIKAGNMTVTETGTDSVVMATAIAGAINAGTGTHGFSAIAEDSIIMIWRADNVAFDFSIGDSWGDQASFGWQDSVSKIEDLPAKMPGFSLLAIGTIGITGVGSSNTTQYYVEWTGEKWKETYGKWNEDEFAITKTYNVTLMLSKMPVKVVRQIDGSFLLGHNQYSGDDGFLTDWGQRIVGDSDSSPVPSFVGKTISNMFFHRNRLGFTSDENVIFSETGSYYNFFRTTAMEILDSDPIDASVDSNTVSNIRSVNLFAGGLLLWADNEQFLLNADSILSPATVRIQHLSSYYADNSLQPVNIDNSVVFFQKKGSYLDVLSFSGNSLSLDNSTSSSIASHIPKYIPSTIKNVKASTKHNMMFLLDEIDNSSLYIYNYYVEKEEKVISAWHKWTFVALAITSIEILDGVLFLIMESGSVLNIELDSMPLDTIFEDKYDVSNTNQYDSEFVMSKYNIELEDEIKDFREPFYIKTVKLSKDGDVNLDIINSERATTKTVDTKYTGRKLFIGGNSEKIRIGLSSKGTAGMQINAVSIEGDYNPRSKNI